MPATTPTAMTALVATPAGSGWTRRERFPRPEPAPNEALVRVRAVGINRGELTLLRIRDEGFRPGQDLAGEVVEAAGDGSGPRRGQRVAGLADWRAWAEYAAVPTERLAPIPDGVDDSAAAALPMAGTTALNVLRAGSAEGGLLGRRVTVTGASGGVGGFAAQLARLGGAEVLAVSAVDAGVPDGQDLILESVGGDSFEQAVRALAPEGTIVSFGNSSGERSGYDFWDFAGHENARLRIFHSHRYAARAGRNLATLLGLVAAGKLTVEIGHEAPWEEVDAALDAFAARELSGKAVLRVG